MFLKPVLALATSTGIALSAWPQATPLRFSDLGVYAAVLDHTIRPLVGERRGSKDRTERIQVANRTVASCATRRVPEMPCIQPDELRDLYVLGAPNDRQLFGNLLAPADRAVIAAAFITRNRQSVLLPRWDGPEVRILSDAGLREQSVHLSSAGASGFAGFSQPAYSANGQAIVYAFYLCGNMCGHGWLLLLRHGAHGWEVQETHALWVS